MKNKKEVKLIAGTDYPTKGLGIKKNYENQKDQLISPIVDNFLMENKEEKHNGLYSTECDLCQNKINQDNKEEKKSHFCMAGLGEECDCNQDNKESNWEEQITSILRKYLVDEYFAGKFSLIKEMKDFISNLFSLQQKKQKEEILNWIATYSGGITVGKTLEDLRSFINNLKNK